VKLRFERRLCLGDERRGGHPQLPERRRSWVAGSPASTATIRLRALPGAQEPGRV
jgi:hypothetical protein